MAALSRGRSRFSGPISPALRPRGRLRLWPLRVRGRPAAGSCRRDSPDLIFVRARASPIVRTRNPIRSFWWAKTCSTVARTDDFRAFPRAMWRGIGRPGGLFRWMCDTRPRCCSACNFDPQYQATSIAYRADRRATHAPNNTFMTYGTRMPVAAFWLGKGSQ